jgi:hypothetical protein
MRQGEEIGMWIKGRERGKTTRLRFGSLLLLLLFASTPCSADDTRGNPAAHLLPSEFASEHWEFTAQFDSGHLLFIEFLITNIGLGDRNAAAIGYVVAPDGNTSRFTNGRREGHWNLSPDRLCIEVGASLLDAHDPAYHIQVNKRSVHVDLHFRPDGPAVWSEALSPPGYALDLLAAAVPVEGTLWVKGMTEPVTVHGTLAATHSWMNEAGSSLVLRRLEFFALQENFPLYGIDLTTPKGRRIQWMVVKQQGKKEYESHMFELSLDGQTKEPRDPGYEVPGAFHLKNAEMEGQVRLERVLVRNDPLADLPQPFHFLVALALDLRPRRVWALSPFEIVSPTDPPPAEHTPQRVRGTGVTAVTFLNPMPVAQPKVAARVSGVSRVYQRPD